MWGRILQPRMGFARSHSLYLTRERVTSILCDLIAFAFGLLVCTEDPIYHQVLAGAFSSHCGFLFDLFSLFFFFFFLLPPSLYIFKPTEESLL